jgi:hypothetical protein
MLGGINNALFLKSFSGFLVVAVLAIILRWAFSNNKSLIERPKKIGSDDEYGLLKVKCCDKSCYRLASKLLYRRQRLGLRSWFLKKI